MAYRYLATKSGKNMYDMASLLQKAARRGEFNLTSYAANEMYEGYHGMLWKRILTISCEDCWGVLTKELLALRAKDEEARANGAPEMQHVSNAVALLCRALKSRDACYFACNFVLTPNERDEIEVDSKHIERMKDMLLNLRNAPREYEQMGFLPAKRRTVKTDSLTPDGSDPYYAVCLLREAINILDMENIGYAISLLRVSHRDLLWDALILISILNGATELTNEIMSLKTVDGLVNGKKDAESKDEIFLSKSVMLLCYARSGEQTLMSSPIINPYSYVNWKEYEGIREITNSTLPGGIIPEWVYDVHTIKGKKAGKTDWIMNLDEQAGLDPIKVSFFDEGSWGPRYDFKHAHGMCTEGEYLASLEYRKTHEGNPVKKLERVPMREIKPEDIPDDAIRSLYEHCLE